MVVIPLYILPICTHHNHDVSSTSRYGAHKPIGFLFPFAIRCFCGIAIADSYDYSYIHCLYICTWIVHVIAIKDIWIWNEFDFENQEYDASVLKDDAIFTSI